MKTKPYILSLLSGQNQNLTNGQTLAWDDGFGHIAHMRFMFDVVPQVQGLKTR